MENDFTFDDFEKGIMNYSPSQKSALKKRFDELEVEFYKATDREVARQFAAATLAAARRETLDILRKYHAFATEGAIPL